MSNEHFGITATYHARLAELGSLHSRPLTIQLSWDNSQPLIITLTCDPYERYPTTWTLAREMLAMGMQQAIVPTNGDVSVLPRTPGFPKTMTIGLHPAYTDQAAGILIDRVDMAMFLDRTFDIVPLGQERIDIDAALTQLLGEAS